MSDGESRGNRRGLARARAGSAIVAELAPRIDDPAEARGWALNTLRTIVDEARRCEPPQLSPAVGALKTLLEHLPKTEGPRLGFANAREALAWWRAHEAELEAMARAEGADDAGS